MKRALWVLAAGLAACSDEAIVVTTGGETTCDRVCVVGESLCEGEKVKTCREDGKGCVTWSVRACEGDAVCKNGTCEAQEEACRDECPEMGALECTEDAAAFRKCSNFDDDECLEWSAPQPCASGCEAGQCVEACDDACTLGEAECEGAGVRTCQTGSDGCTEWGPVTACPGGKCAGGTCVEVCADACTLDESECEGAGVRMCQTGSDGCTEWGPVTACPGGKCSDGACVEACADACTMGESACGGAGVRMCRIGSDGCTEWGPVTACEYGCQGGACKSAPQATRYLGTRILSPMTPYVVQKMKEISGKNAARNDKSFIKVGDSHFAPGSVFMYCFSTSSPKHSGYNLNGLKVEDAVSAFQSSFDAFNRDSAVAVVGMTATWLMGNGRTKLDQELQTTNPRFAFYDYGTNDMGAYSTTTQYMATLEKYYNKVLDGLGVLMDGGTIPLLIGTGWRTDYASLGATQPKHYVTTFSAVSRGIAEYYQIPFYDLQLSHSDISGFGLGSDGVHHSAINYGCDFTSAGLAKGANRRNRYAIEMLARAWRALTLGSGATDDTIPFEGSGTHADPYLITSLPYTHMASTVGGEKKFNTYACRTTGEYGPERVYRLEVASSVKIRAFAASRTDVDVDIHLLKSLSKDASLACGNRWVEATLSPGTYYFVVDTCNNDGSNTSAGTYLFGVHLCDADDTACGASATGG